MFLTRIKGNEMKTQLKLPFNTVILNVSTWQMQLAFKARRVRVRLKEHLVAQKENTLALITILIFVNFTGIKP